ncbi:hypothetical protein WJX84_000641 [Apatococcus fuscideae]|uniref:Secreted protein n=1 Tax=Apatococcus fuscideae TaxID=2026836 RepID=A0AAW1T0V6_9CHLO
MFISMSCFIASVQAALRALSSEATHCQALQPTSRLALDQQDLCWQMQASTVCFLIRNYSQLGIRVSPAN